MRRSQGSWILIQKLEQETRKEKGGGEKTLLRGKVVSARVHVGGLDSVVDEQERSPSCSHISMLED